MYEFMYEDAVGENPIKTKCVRSHSTCGGLLVLIYISVNLRPHISPPLHPCDVP